MHELHLMIVGDLPTSLECVAVMRRSWIARPASANEAEQPVMAILESSSLT